MLDKLLHEALAVQANAYAPYSGFKVGAAVLTGSGNIFSGCNVENASYSLTVCAERNAIFKAVSAGEREFKMLVLTSSGGDFTPPCGACRQVMSEFGDFEVVLVNSNGEQRRYRVSELLPVSFHLEK